MARHPNVSRRLAEISTRHPAGDAAAELALEIAAWLEPLGQVSWRSLVERHADQGPLQAALDMLASHDLAGVRFTVYADGRRAKRVKWLGGL